DFIYFTFVRFFSFKITDEHFTALNSWIFRYFIQMFCDGFTFFGKVFFIIKNFRNSVIDRIIDQIRIAVKLKLYFRFERFKKEIREQFLHLIFQLKSIVRKMKVFLAYFISDLMYDNIREHK